MNEFMPPVIHGQDSETFWLRGCLVPQQAYQVSPLKSAIFLVLENLFGCHEVLLDVEDHPATWPSKGLVAVSMQASRHGSYLLGEDSQVITPQNFKSLCHLPVSRVSSMDTVMGVEQWLELCPFQFLRNFAFQVLGEPAVGCAFFNLPASAKHHHCYPGGLAEHSLEVAQSVYAASGCFPEHERWLAAVAGLLHDLGKVRSFHPDGSRTETGYLVSHELLGLELALPALAQLDTHWPDGANALRYLFDWMLRPKQQRPLMPIALSIRQADVMSAAANNRQRTFSQLPEWQTFARDQGPGPISSYWLPSPP